MATCMYIQAYRYLYIGEFIRFLLNSLLIPDYPFKRTPYQPCQLKICSRGVQHRWSFFSKNRERVAKNKEKGSVVKGDIVKFDIEEALHNEGTIESDTLTDINAGSLLNSGGSILSKETVSVKTVDDLVNDGGTIRGKKNTILETASIALSEFDEDEVVTIKTEIEKIWAKHLMFST